MRGDATAALAVVEEASDAGTDLQVLIRSLIAALRNLLVARIDPQLLARDLAPEDAARAGEQASTLSQAMLMRALRTFTEALALARSGGNARLELETALLRFILTGEDPTLDALSARLAALEEGSPARRRLPVARGRAVARGLTSASASSRSADAGGGQGGSAQRRAGTRKSGRGGSLGAKGARGLAKHSRQGRRRAPIAARAVIARDDRIAGE